MTLLSTSRKESRFGLEGGSRRMVFPCFTDESFDNLPRDEKRLYNVILQYIFEKNLVWDAPPINDRLEKVVAIESWSRMSFRNPEISRKTSSSDSVRIKSAGAIRDIIRSRDSKEISHLEDVLYGSLEGREKVLADVALDPNELINVRAMATRLFIAKIFSWPVRESSIEVLANRLAGHDSPLIRLGALLGFADANNMRRVRTYLSDDPHPEVVAEAQEILEDAKDE